MLRHPPAFPNRRCDQLGRLHYPFLLENRLGLLCGFPNRFFNPRGCKIEFFQSLRLYLCDVSQTLLRLDCALKFFQWPHAGSAKSCVSLGCLNIPGDCDEMPVNLGKSLLASCSHEGAIHGTDCGNEPSVSLIRLYGLDAFRICCIRLSAIPACASLSSSRRFR